MMKLQIPKPSLDNTKDATGAEKDDRITVAGCFVCDIYVDTSDSSSSFYSLFFQSDSPNWKGELFMK